MRKRLFVVAFLVALTGLTVVGQQQPASGPTNQGVLRLTITAPTVTEDSRDLAITPDGTRIVYVGNNGTQLFVTDQLAAIPLTTSSATSRPRHPFVSPDGRWVGFFEDDGLKKVAIAGGPVLPICRIPSGEASRGATWGTDGTIIFQHGASTIGLRQVSSAGGEPTVLTRVDGTLIRHRWPEWLPGGEAVLFTMIPGPLGSEANAQVAVLDLKTGTQKILVQGFHAHYVTSGHLVYGVPGTLRAVAFDLNRLEVVGAPFPVLQQVITTGIGAANFDVASNGTLVYMSGAPEPATRTLVWVDRKGQEEPIEAPVRAYVIPRLSPDATHVALDIRDQERNIWMWDIAREALTRFTFGRGPDRSPTWTPDGQWVLFGSTREGSDGLFWQRADGSGPMERLTRTASSHNPTAVSPDGGRVVFYENAATQDIMTLALDKERRVQPPPQGSGEPGRSVQREVRPLLQTSVNELNGEISPDGRWLAYQSNESGQRNEVYVRPFPNVTAGKWQISSEGGTHPLWARNGQELFYLAPTATPGNIVLMSVRVERGATWAAATPTKLFEGRYYSQQQRSYDVSPDGQRFLMIKRAPAQPPSVIVAQSWLEELKRLASAK